MSETNPPVFRPVFPPACPPMATLPPPRVSRRLPPWRAATLSVLLALSGCGGFGLSGSRSTVPGMSLAETALQSGGAEMALRFSEGVLEEFPNNVRAREIRGDALALLGDTARAEADFQALLADDQGSIRANIGLGRLRVAKNPAAAEALFLTVLKREPKNLIALNNLGICRDLLHRHQDAQTAYRQALAIDPALESARVNLALSMAMTGQGDAAAAMLRPKAIRDGASAKAKHDYAVVLAMAGRRPEAQRILSQNMTPAEAAQVLDSVTATRAQVVRGNGAEAAEPVQAAEESAVPIATQVARLAGARRLDDLVPADVVQIIPAVPAPVPARATPVSLVRQAPVVMRPPSDPAADPGSPVDRPTDPVAAAAMTARMLSSPFPAASKASAAETADETIAPEVVTMPAPPPRAARASARGSAAFSAPPPATLLALTAPAGAPTGAPAGAPVAAPMGARAGVPVAAAAAAQAEVAVPPRIAVVPPVPVLPGATKIETTAAAHADSVSPGATVQFAAAPTEAAGLAFWRKLRDRFPNALGGLSPAVVQGERDGVAFWRVRAEGFGDGAAAAALCAKMRAAGQACFVPRS